MTSILRTSQPRKAFAKNLREKKRRKIPHASYLANVALHYLGRYAASEASLRRVLENRIRRAAMDHPEFAQDAAKQLALRETITAIIESHKRTGVLNDASFAAMKVGSMRRQGRSARLITQKLQVKGIAGGLIATALNPDDDYDLAEQNEAEAAHRFAKKRRLGIYRQKPEVENQRHKDLSAMARAGFSIAVAKKALDGEEEF